MSQDTQLSPRQTTTSRRPPKRVHLVGIAGAGMRSLAGMLHAAGWNVSGSDPRAAELRGAPYPVFSEHRAEAVDASIDMVIHSAAVDKDNLELARAAALGIECVSYPRMLARLMQAHRGVAIAGTHGKSTTTALAGAIMHAAGFDPTVVYGAEPVDADASSRMGRGPWMLAEACEYRENFCHLNPEVAVVLGIEWDHVDCFDAITDVEAAFGRFAARVPAEGLVLASADCPATQRIARRLNCAVETFGFSPAATWQATALRERRGYYSFQVRRRRRLVCEVKMPLAGRHNVHNALAAAAVANRLGAGPTAIRLGLERFAGLKRRLEVQCEVATCPVISDYAHHPTAVAAALATVRQSYPERRIWCVFEPHQVLRTARLLDDFARALHNADTVLIGPVYRARENTLVAGTVTADLCRAAQTLGTRAACFDGFAAVAQHLHNLLRPGDVVVALGAGDIGALAHELGQRFRTIRKAG